MVAVAVVATRHLVQDVAARAVAQVKRWITIGAFMKPATIAAVVANIRRA